MSKHLRTNDSQTINFRKICINTIIKLFDNIYVELDANEICSFTFYYLEFTIWVIWNINSIIEPNVWKIAILFRLMMTSFTQQNKVV